MTVPYCGDAGLASMTARKSLTFADESPAQTKRYSPGAGPRPQAVRTMKKISANVRPIEQLIEVRILHPVRNYVRLRDALHGRRARLAHDHLDLLAQESEHRLHSLLPERRETPDVGPPNPRRRRAERERLEDVGAATNTAVDNHRNA